MIDDYIIDAMSELGVGLESRLGLENLAVTEMNYHLQSQGVSDAIGPSSSCNWTFRS